MQSRYEKLHMVMIRLCLLYSQDVKPAGTIPFEIEDLPGIQTITLRRQYGNEEIKVEFMSGDVGDDNDEENSGSDTNSGRVRVNLTVSVSKGEGPFLEFICTGYSDGVSIEGMAVKQKQETELDAVDPIPYEGPPFYMLAPHHYKHFPYKYPYIFYKHTYSKDIFHHISIHILQSIRLYNQF